MAATKLRAKLQAIANAIRAKTGKTGQLTLDEMAAEIAAIQTGSSDLPFDFGGLNAAKVATYHEQFTLADTSFEVGVSAATSSTTIKAAVSNRYTTPDAPTVAYGDKDIVVVQTCEVTPTHGAGATGKAQQIKYTCVHVTYISKRKTTDSSGRTYRIAGAMSSYMDKYLNTSAAETRAQANYGFYMTPSAAGAASTSAASTYVRASSPVLYYRASSTYESTANIKTVTECTFDWTVDVYTVDPFTTPMAAVNAAIDAVLCK